MELDLSIDMVKVEEFYKYLQDMGLNPVSDDFDDLEEGDLQLLWKIYIQIKLM